MESQIIQKPIQDFFYNKAQQEDFIKEQKSDKKGDVLEAYFEKLNNIFQEFITVSYIKVELKAYIFELLKGLLSLDTEYLISSEKDQKFLLQMIEEKKNSKGKINKTDRKRIYDCFQCYVIIAKKEYPKNKPPLDKPLSHLLDKQPNIIKNISPIFDGEIIQKIADIRKKYLDDKKSYVDKNDKQFIFDLLTKCMENDNNNQILSLESKSIFQNKMKEYEKTYLPKSFKENIFSALQKYIQKQINDPIINPNVFGEDEITTIHLLEFDDNLDFEDLKNKINESKIPINKEKKLNQSLNKQSFKKDDAYQQKYFSDVKQLEEQKKDNVLKDNALKNKVLINNLVKDNAQKDNINKFGGDLKKCQYQTKNPETNFGNSEDSQSVDSDEFQ